MQEYSEVRSNFYSEHPLGVGISESENNVRIGSGKFGTWIEEIASENLNEVIWWSKTQLEDFFGKEDIDKLFDRIYLDLCSLGFIVSPHIHDYLCEKMFFNSSYPLLNDPSSTFRVSQSIFSFKLDQSSMGVNLWKVINRLSDKEKNPVSHNIQYKYIPISHMEIYFYVELNSTEKWINSIELKSLDVNLYFSVLQEMLEKMIDSQTFSSIFKYNRRILYISFLSHYGFTKTIENEIVSPCNNVFGCYDLQRYIGSFL